MTITLLVIAYFGIGVFIVAALVRYGDKELEDSPSLPIVVLIWPLALVWGLLMIATESLAYLVRRAIRLLP
jgi:hypothetical protein